MPDRAARRPSSSAAELHLPGGRDLDVCDRTYSPGGRSWRGSAQCIPTVATRDQAQQLNSARGEPYTYRPSLTATVDDHPHWHPHCERLVAAWMCHLCLLAVGATTCRHTLWAGASDPLRPWIGWIDHPDIGPHIPAMRCGGNGIVIPLHRGVLRAWQQIRDDPNATLRHQAEHAPP